MGIVEIFKYYNEHNIVNTPIYNGFDYISSLFTIKISP